MRMGLAVALLAQMAVVAADPGPSEHAREVTSFAYGSLYAAILQAVDESLAGHHDTTMADPGGLVILLGEIDTPEARDVLVQLMDRYLGEATEEALTYAVLRQGAKIREKLVGARQEPPACVADRKSPRCLTAEEKRRRIEHMLDLIAKGVKPTYAL